ncbi:MAG: hypothetical protein N2482_00395 [Patescibacteria group bacterium]|nr:hypothetical protein [Patescibacteria group bacterium]
MKIVPALLEKTPVSFFLTINQLLPYFSYFQIDITDGQCVPNKTLSLKEILPILFKINTQKKLIFDLHLMVVNWKKELNQLKKMSLPKNIFLNNVFVHSPFFPLLEKKQIVDLQLGMVINPQDNIETIGKKYDLKKIKIIQIMSVEPGFQGSPFLPETLKKIEQLRLASYRSKIYLDGGINEKTLPQILSLKYQPDFLCIGSFLTKTELIKERVDFLRKTIG